MLHKVVREDLRGGQRPKGSEGVRGVAAREKSISDQLACTCKGGPSLPGQGLVRGQDGWNAEK